MIKFLRQGAIENPWVFRAIMLVIVVTFVITMGWFGFSGEESPTIAQVDDRPISLAEYERTYRNYERFYRDMFKEQFNADLIKQLDLKHMVINALVERELWLETARRMNLTVTSRELANAIASMTAFQQEKSGRFDPEVYRRVLAANHVTPETFESSQRDELLIAKVKAVIGDSTAVSGPEWEEVRDRQAAQNPGPTSDATLPSPLPQKQERVLRAYMDYLRHTAVVNIQEKML